MTKAKVRVDKPDHYKSDWERRYAAFLEAEKRSGVYLEWLYEGEKLKAGEGAWCTPDFRVINEDGEIEFHEVKGFWTEAAKVRFKAVKALHPYYRFIIVRPSKYGMWQREEF